MVDDDFNVIALVPAKGNVFSFREATPSEIEREQSNVLWDEDGEAWDTFDARRTVSMQVDYAGKFFARSLNWLEMRASQSETYFISYVNVCAFDMHAFRSEFNLTYLFSRKRSYYR